MFEALSISEVIGIVIGLLGLMGGKAIYDNRKSKTTINKSEMKINQKSVGGKSNTQIGIQNNYAKKEGENEERK